MAQEDMFTAVFSGEARTKDLNLRLAHELIAKGRYCDVIGAESGFEPFRLPEHRPPLQPILEILPVQMMTLALAGLSEREAGHFEHATKVTLTE
jgi:glucosamine--fructose-6-phosphate aminotransferase (isomerizing)